MKDKDPNQLIRIDEVSRLTSIAKSTIRLWVALGKFPAPINLSPTLKVWRVSDLDRWIEAHSNAPKRLPAEGSNVGETA